MKVKRQREIYLKDLKSRTHEFWVKVVEDYNNGLTAREIALKYTNPNTKKPYTREHIYSILSKMQNVHR